MGAPANGAARTGILARITRDLNSIPPPPSPGADFRPRPRARPPAPRPRASQRESPPTSRASPRTAPISPARPSSSRPGPPRRLLRVERRRPVPSRSILGSNTAAVSHGWRVIVADARPSVRGERDAVGRAPARVAAEGRRVCPPVRPAGCGREGVGAGVWSSRDREMSSRRLRFFSVPERPEPDRGVSTPVTPRPEPGVPSGDPGADHAPFDRGGVEAAAGGIRAGDDPRPLGSNASPPREERLSGDVQRLADPLRASRSGAARRSRRRTRPPPRAPRSEGSSARADRRTRWWPSSSSRRATSLVASAFEHG